VHSPLGALSDLEPIASGAMLDRYRIVRHVASGGMGSVWEGSFAGKYGFTKRVAIKTILPQLAGERRFTEMFLEEARLTSRLSHAHVAQVLDVGDHEGTMYIVFEWVDGESLEVLCRAAESRGEALPLDLALRVVADVCAGLHAAHELTSDDGRPLHVVHRDVTPHNVLVSRDGYAKVIDFGLAKARDRIGAPTRSGLVKGTPQFMAPEQALGHPVDRRADVFSAGALLFRVLAGHPPFPDRESLAAFIHGERAPELPPSTPEPVRAVVFRAMRRDPAERFATAADMRLALERATHMGLAAAFGAPPPVSPELAPTPVDGERLPAPAPPATPAPAPAAAATSGPRGLLIALLLAIGAVTCAATFAMSS